MKRLNIKWLFFDLGSTLIDESACEEHRLRALAAQPGAPDIETLSEAMRGFAARLMHPYRSTATLYGLAREEWPVHLEKLYPGVPETLERLSRKYRLGIIANQNPGTEERLAAFGIREYFDVIAASGEEGAAKPGPELFLTALRRAGCRPEEAAMIGDRPDNDIIPAKKLGMYTVWVKQGIYACADEHIFVRPDLTIDRTGGIEEYF